MQVRAVSKIAPLGSAHNALNFSASPSGYFPSSQSIGAAAHVTSPSPAGTVTASSVVYLHKADDKNYPKIRDMKINKTYGRPTSRKQGASSSARALDKKHKAKTASATTFLKI